MFNRAAKIWLAEQQKARRQSMHEEATAAKDDLTLLQRLTGFVASPDKDPRLKTCTQDRVDTVRARVQYTVAFEAARQGTREVPVKHLWFPENRVTKYELRDGNPPSDADRPRHLRGLNLVIDLEAMDEVHWLGIEEIARQKNKRRYKNRTPSLIMKGNRALMERMARRAGLARRR